VDYVFSGTLLFDIGGNKYRLIAPVTLRKDSIVERVLTHDEYRREDSDAHRHYERF